MPNARENQWILPLLALAGLLLAAIPTMLARGPWYDEFYTFYAADPALGFVEALKTRWLTDNHPPLFYALSWVTGWLGDGVAQRRFVNIFILAGFVIGLAILWRTAPAIRRFGAYYVLALAGCSITVLSMAEFRSNFLAIASSALMLAALLAVTWPRYPATWKAGWAVLALAMLVAFNTHFTATLISGCLGASFGVWLLLRREWRLAGRLAAIGVLASLPFLMLMAVQFSGIEQNTRSFWIPAGFDFGRWTMQRFLIELLIEWPALTVFGAMGFGMLAAAAWRERGVGPELQLLLVLATAAVVAVIILLGLHLWRPIIITRYLYTLAPILALALATGTAAVLERLAGLVRLAIILVIVMLACLSLFDAARKVPLLPSYDGTAARIAQLSEQCRGIVVHPALAWNAYVLGLPPAGNRTVVPMAYRMAAQSHGFLVESEISRKVAAQCPTIFWAEHVSGQNSTQAEIEGGLKRMGYSLGSTMLERIGDGWILISRP